MTITLEALEEFRMKQKGELLWVCRIKGGTTLRPRAGCIGTARGVNERQEEGEPNPVIMKPEHEAAGCGWFRKVS